MRFIDTHLHCWDRDRFDYPWLEGSDLPRRFTPSDIGEGAAGARAIFMEADRRGDQAVPEARWALELRDGPVPVVAAVAHAPLGQDGGADAVLHDLAGIPGVTGIRRLLQDEPIDFFADRGFLADLRTTGRLGFCFDACVRSEQLSALAQVAQSAPDTVIVLDHVGKPALDDPAGAISGAWREGIAALARCENVVVKISGMVPADGPLRSVRPWVDVVLEAFGPDRAVLGSDWPVSRRPGSRYADWFAFVLQDCGLTAGEADSVGFRNAERIYRVPV